MPSSPPKTLGIVLKPASDSARAALEKVLEWLAEHQEEFHLERVLVHQIGRFQDFRFSWVEGCDERGLAETDLVLVLGGDGTLLWAVRMLEDYEVPILGVNVGNLGFLTEVPLEDFPEPLTRALKGEVSLEYRSMLACFLRRGSASRSLGIALNDVVIARGPSGRLIELSVDAEDTFINRYRADGLILATSTGSTAYNLAAGGPILAPGLEATILTPICPHTLSNRALVIPSDTTLTVRLEEGTEEHGEVCVIVDGQRAASFTGKDELVVRKSRHRMCLVKNLTLDYFHIVRTKLKWG